MANISSDTPTTNNPYLDSLIWGGKWVPDSDDPGGVPQIAYYLASGPDPAFPGFATSPWSQTQITAFESVLQLYRNVANVDFVRVFDPAQADDIERLTDSSHPYLDGNLGIHDIPDPADQFSEPLKGYYNIEEPTIVNPAQGNFGFMIFIHELGHSLGLAHPHDGGSDGQVFPGVTPDHPADKGDYGLNQGIWTVMSYNDGWDHVPPVYPSYGYEATPMALDVAALQVLYGANMTFHTGDDVYALPTANGPGTFWSCIWDAGGAQDEIDGTNAAGACTVNLNAAPLIGPNAGGFVSWVSGIHGGFTIAHDVVIENAAGGKGADTLTGNDADNNLTGNAGNDSLIGGLGADTVDGGLGTDRMAGGAGDDLYWVDTKADIVRESAGSGTDTVDSFVTLTLAGEVENLDLQGNVAIDGTGNLLDNILVGNSAANILDGKGGADTMQGGKGNDTYLVDALGDKADETGGDGADTVKSSVDGYTLNTDVENLTLVGKAISGFGNELANIIIGTAAGNTLSGLDGNDSLNGDKGNDTLTGGKNDDTLDGGAGSDTMSGGDGNDLYRIDVVGDKIDPGADAGIDTVESKITFILGAAQENLTLLGTAAINGTGNDSGNVITGNAGANILDGGTTGETDTMIGGAGNDTYLVDATGDKVTELDLGGTDLVKSSQTYTLSEFVENLTLLPGKGNIDGTGNGANNLITGNEGDNRLDGKAGADTLIGGLGNDVYVVDVAGDKVMESSAAGGHDGVESKITYTLGANLEDLKLTDGGAIDGIGNALPNLLVGGSGANKLDGKAGADTMQGGLGDDIYVIDNLKDQVDESGGGVNDSDTIQIATAFDLQAPTITILGTIENVALTGTAALNASGNALANDLTGNGGANVLTGLGGDDILDGLAGADTLIGGDGNVTYVIDSTKDVVRELGSGTADLIQGSIAIDLGLIGYDGVEDAALTGTGALSATGDEQNNHLTGNGGANLLSGKDGDDTLVGGLGNDTLVGAADADSLAGGAGNDSLDGGAGADSLAGGLGNDTYLIDDLGNLVTEFDTEGTDTERSAVASLTLAAFVENLVLLAGTPVAVSGIGNSLNNVITGNEFANTLDGGAGVDTLVGGKSDDSYLVDDAKDVVTEAASAGTDTVASTAAGYVLGANIENLVLGAGALSGTGNALNNTLTGNGDDNTLDGKAGKDHMIGGAGTDTYVVDNIGDVVDEGGGTGADTVKSAIAFSLVENGTTVIGTIENLTLTGTGNIAGTGNDFANHIIGNAGANKLLGAGGVDILEGGAGADTLDGGAGNDSIAGGAGNDRIDVGAGDDTVFYTSKLDGKDVIDNFQGSKDVLNLDGLFDTLALPGTRADHVSLVDHGASVDVRVDADGKASNGFELVVATLNTTDTIVVGTDIVVGS